jgi:EmrB/QacA subfamily drug resistance transporter
MAQRTIAKDDVGTRRAPAAATRVDARRGHRPGLALAVIVAGQLMLVLDGTIVNIALPHIKERLGFSATGLSWVLNAYTLAFGGLLLLGGRAGDILGRRRVLVGGIALFTVASLLGGFATAPGWLLAARAAQGVGAAIAAPSTLALITTNFPEGPARTRAIGIYSAVQAAGASIGLIAGGMLTDWVSWRWVLFVNVPIGIAVAVLTPRFVAESARQPGRFDLGGALTATGGMTALVYGFIRAAADGWGNGLTLAAFAAAAVLLALFLFVERRAAQPIVPLRLFGERTRAAAYLNMLLLPAAMLGMFFFLSQFVQVALGFSPVAAGFAFLPLTAVIFASSQFVPRLLPRVGAKPIVVAGAALIAIGMTWLTRITADTDYASGLLGPMLLFGLGAGFSLVPLSLLILSGVEGADSGAASGLLQTMQQIGGSLGIAVLVTRYGTVSRRAAEDALVGLSAEARAHQIMAEAMTSALVVAALIAGAALVVALAVIRPRPASDASHVSD